MDAIKKLYIEPSSLCNFHCTMCFRNAWIDESQGLMSEETFQSILHGLNSPLPETVMFGGMGEPLLHPAITRYVSAFQQAGCRTEITTNGSLLTESMSRSLCEAGIHTVWVSMESFMPSDYEGIRSGANYQSLLTNIAEFNRIRNSFDDIELGISLVILKENIHELNSIDIFADQVHADWINISHAIPGRPTAHEDTTFDLPFPVGRMHRLKDAAKVSSSLGCRFIETDNSFVRWDGDVAPCMQLLHESNTWLFEEQRRINRVSFGNVCKKPLFDIWHASAYQEFRNRVLSFDFPDCVHCDGCELRLDNRTDCFLNPFPTCGACLWSQNLVFCP